LKLIALLAWYDESPKWLAHCVRSLPVAGVSHLVALDGAYALYPEAAPSSPPEQSAAIRDAAREAGIGCDVHVPDQVWAGNEIEKRSALFALAERVAEPNRDWYFVVDADCVIEESPDDLLEQLAATELDVGEVMMWEPGTVTGPARDYSRWRRDDCFDMRSFFRAIPGLRVEGNHYNYVTPEGRRLWGHNRRHLTDALNLRQVRVTHRSRLRSIERAERQYAYYRDRDRLRVENDLCERCGKRAVRSLPTNWQPDPRGMSADWINVCAGCARIVGKENEKVMRQYGLDPVTLRPDPQAQAVA
jgi:hypothetical protein